ncbi:MAG: hypothetical protein M1594_02450, partial [Candidatus Marsarchaeota archaeon]|nr:hypothetical protein [Candidatus Marsarchaeota archaeon]
KGELNYRVENSGDSIASYLDYAENILNHTALWRNNLDIGAPLKYFGGDFNFIRVFKVDSNDNLYFNKNYTDSGDSCPPVSNTVNSILTNTLGSESNFVSSTIFSPLRKIPRGFYVVNYSYSVDSDGNAVGGYNGWIIQSTPLVLNSGNYFQNFGNGGCDFTQIPSSLPLCGYVFSTNNYNTFLGGKGLGNCVLSSSAYIGNSFKNNNLASYLSNAGASQLSTDDIFYTSSLIPLNFSCTFPNCFQGSLQNYPLINFINFPASPISSSFMPAQCSLFNLFTFGVFDDAGDVFINNPGSCGNGLMLTPNPNKMEATANSNTLVSSSIFNNFNAQGLH